MSEASPTGSDSPLRRRRVWIVLAVLYALFFYWYTPFGGPLTDAEIAEFERTIRDFGRTDIDLPRWKAFFESDTGGDFAMFNALDLRDVPSRIEGVEPGDSAADVMSRYMEPFFATAMRDAAHPVLGGSAAAQALDLWGIDGAVDWDQGGVVRYRSRRDVMHQIMTVARNAHETGVEIHAFKIAALEKTIAFPLDPWFQLGDPRFVLALVFLVLGLGADVRRLSRGGASG